MPYKDPEKKRAYDAAYRAAHREERRAYDAAYTAVYRAAHREETRVAVARYRASTLGILADERHYQKRIRGLDAVQD